MHPDSKPHPDSLSFNYFFNWYANSSITHLHVSISLVRPSLITPYLHDWTIPLAYSVPPLGGRESFCLPPLWTFAFVGSCIPNSGQKTRKHPRKTATAKAMNLVLNQGYKIVEILSNCTKFIFMYIPVMSHNLDSNAISERCF